MKSYHEEPSIPNPPLSRPFTRQSTSITQSLFNYGTEEPKVEQLPPSRYPTKGGSQPKGESLVTYFKQSYGSVTLPPLQDWRVSTGILIQTGIDQISKKGRAITIGMFTICVTLVCLLFIWVGAKNITRLLIARADEQLATQQYEAAGQSYSRVLFFDWDNLHAIRNRGDARLALKDYAGAEEDFTTCVAALPLDAGCHIKRAQVRMETDQLEGALADLLVAGELTPQDSALYLLQVDIYERREQYQEIVTLLTRAIEALEEPNAQVYLERARAYLVLGKTELAQKDFEQVIALAPDAVDAYIKLGTLAFEQGNLEQALQYLNHAEQLEDSNARLFATRARIYEQQEKIPESIADLERALTLRPNDSKSLLLRGKLYRQQGQMDAALLDFNGVLKLEPDHHKARLERARTYEQTGDYEQALEDVDYLITQAPLNEEALWVQVRLLEALSDYTRADETLLHLKQLEPQNLTEVVLRQMKLRERQGELHAAIALTVPAIEAGAEPIFLLSEAGRLHYKLAEYQESRCHYESVLSLEPEHVPAYRGLAYALRQLDYKQSAINAFREYLTREPNAPDDAKIREWVRKHTARVLEVDMPFVACATILSVAQ
jgi:tetratricopeptide (TPR) repeat protein